MPRLWEDSIDTHRRAVRDAVLDVTASLVAESGLQSVRMSRIADRAGISRGTLYKYFADVDAVLCAWHERQLGAHLEQLAGLARGDGTPAARLAAVLGAFAAVKHHHPGDGAVAALHGGAHVARAAAALAELVRDLLAEGVARGEVRDDVGPGELAGYCLHALTAAGYLPSQAAVSRLVAVTLSGLRPVGVASAPGGGHSGDAAHSPPSPGGPMSENDPSSPADASELTATPSGKAAVGEGSDLHGTAREVHQANHEGGADGAAKTPGA